jgi:hypothetical protein
MPMRARAVRHWPAKWEAMTVNELCRNGVIAIAFYLILVMLGRLARGGLS